MEKKKRWEKNQRKVNKTKTELFKPYWKLTSWDFLGVQWSRLHAPNAKGMSSIHSHRTKIPTCCTVWPKMGKNSPLTKQIQRRTEREACKNSTRNKKDCNYGYTVVSVPARHGFQDSCEYQNPQILKSFI